MMRRKNTVILKNKRKARIRAKIHGTSIRPRLVIDKSNYNLKAQVVDDSVNKILGAVYVEGKNIEAAKQLSQLIVEFAKKKNITQFVYDRGGFVYHGVIKQIADSVREGGITI